MNTDIDTFPFWSTASFGAVAETTPMELSALGEHLSLCHGARGRWFALHCRAEAIHGFVAPRLVTTLALLSLLIGGASLVL